MKKLKILYVNDFWHGGGAEKVFVDTIRIVDEIHEVQHFTAEERYASGNLAKSLIFNNQHKAIFDRITSFKPDIIHIHNIHNRIGSSVFSAIRKARKSGARFKVIHTAHDYFLLWANPSFCYYNTDNDFIKFKELPTFSDFLFKRASGKSIVHSIVRKALWFYIVSLFKVQNEIDLIITPSDFLGNYLKRKLKNTPIVTIRNPCEVSLVTRAQDPNSFADGRAANQNTLRIIFLGRLSDEKGLLPLVDLLKKNPDLPIQLDIYGGGHLKDKLQSKISDNQLEHLITLKGEISQGKKNKIITTYHALILPSVWYENAPLTIVEAAFAGLRILTSNFGGMKELAGLCGGEYLFDPFDPVSFRKAVEQCVHDTFSTSTLLNRDIQKIEDLFSLTNYKKKIIDTYDRGLN